ncbi:MAG TPA: zinc-dependent alcohol dehydrogenase family protein [Thermoanaerobaculia bacterium]|nr:zinc-dependent alcohol dehydrogenase family protein [Thermoanaerobaculia bacterium]HUM31124.1 zinc-dependent alcohol dehydrogenase family protein [Thermoanaerobaculia bacterium]HXK69477.1 zinc-dependent alcohol dehydrogenase family protein [Thermoanaerobaculia bacterium]
MKAMVLEAIHRIGEDSSPLVMRQLPIPEPGSNAILMKVLACGVCHTELDEIEGRTAPPSLPVIPGHQVVGEVVALGEGSSRYSVGDRVGAAWIFSACGSCLFCSTGRENLCESFRATGRDANGGYAEYMTIHENFALPIPETMSGEEAAPLLCAGAIGYRALRLAGLTRGQRLGLMGFGASAHLVLKLVLHLYPEMEVFAFARDEKERAFARELGAVWAGGIQDECPERLHAVIDTTPVWLPVLQSMERLAPGGRLVINAIRKESVDQDVFRDLDYNRHLWMEKEIKSVANITRSDVTEFLTLTSKIPIKPEVQLFSLEEANQALREIKGSKIRGAKVLRIG